VRNSKRLRHLDTFVFSTALTKDSVREVFKIFKVSGPFVKNYLKEVSSSNREVYTEDGLAELKAKYGERLK
jgi:hypothetical protein